MQRGVVIPLYGCKIDYTLQRRSDWPKGRKRYTDEELLKLRWLHSFGGLSPVDIKRKYKIPSTIVGYVFNYEAHSWVVPSFGDFSREVINEVV